MPEKELIKVITVVDTESGLSKDYRFWIFKEGKWTDTDLLTYSNYDGEKQLFEDGLTPDLKPMFSFDLFEGGIK